jgi:hypothetical protein
MQNQCFFDNDRGMATDQKWFMLLPSFFEVSQLFICRDAGMNMAPWNFNERKLITENEQLFVINRFEQGEQFKSPLTFIHFSGYDYQRLSVEKNIIHKGEGLKDYEDLRIAFNIYGKALLEGGFNTYFHLPYSFNQFNTGKNILNLHRRIYRRLADEGKAAKHPFSEGPGTYYESLRKKGLLDNSAISADKMTLKSISGGKRKLGKINFFFRVLLKLLGVKKYSMLIRFLKRYAKEENQVFLADKELGKKLW